MNVILIITIVITYFLHTVTYNRVCNFLFQFIYSYRKRGRFFRICTTVTLMNKLVTLVKCFAKNLKFLPERGNFCPLIVCTCVRERERKRERGAIGSYSSLNQPQLACQPNGARSLSWRTNYRAFNYRLIYEGGSLITTPITRNFPATIKSVARHRVPRLPRQAASGTSLALSLVFSR